MTERSFRGGLFLRVAIHSVLLLVVGAVGFLALTLLLLGSTIDRQQRNFTEWLGLQACDRVATARSIHDALSDFPAPIAVYSSNGRLLASVGRHPLPPLSQSELAALQATSKGSPETAPVHLVHCPGSTARYAIVAAPPSLLPIREIVLLIVALMALVSLCSLPLVRSIVRPLQQLAAVAKRLGTGELAARANIGRDDEIGDLAKALNLMAQNLQSHLLAEKELLANVSHELRTPLARVRVVLESAKDDPARLGYFLGEIAHDLGDLERLTDDVLAAIRLDFSDGQPLNHKLGLRFETIDLRSLLQHSIARCVESYPQRDIELDVVGSIGPVLGDRALLVRLFHNLLDNAQKYSADAIVVRCAESEGAVVVSVEDHGIGIDPSELTLVFEPFYRSDRSRARATGGTGLGLTLSRRIVDAHRGSIALRSVPSQGTTVTVTLPRPAG